MLHSPPCQLEDLCHGETLDLDKQEDLSASQRQLASTIQDQLTIDDRPGGVPASQHAAHLLVSALEGEAGCPHRWGDVFLTAV